MTDPATFWERDVYAKGLQVNKWPFDPLIARVRNEGGRRSPRLALEIGCGTGANLWFLHEEGYLTHGLDISATAIELARRYLESRNAMAELQVSDLGSIPYPDNYFDLTIDRGCLSCIPNHAIPGVVSELFRVLRPGGVHLSFSLYGTAHPDIASGEEVEPWTYHRFRSGRMAKSGQITFFDEERIQALFSAFGPVEVHRHCQFSGNKLDHEDYSAVARK